MTLLGLSCEWLLECVVIRSVLASLSSWLTRLVVSSSESRCFVLFELAVASRSISGSWYVGITLRCRLRERVGDILFSRVSSTFFVDQSRRRLIRLWIDRFHLCRWDATESASIELFVAILLTLHIVSIGTWSVDVLVSHGSAALVLPLRVIEAI